MINYDPILQIFSSTLVNDKKYVSGFGTRQLGDSRNIENVIRFFSSAEISYKTIVLMEQIHSANVEEFTPQNGKEIERIEETDGVVTKESQTPLVVSTADCVPIIFADKKAERIGISHQGWRGSMKKLQQKMVKKMIEKGSRAENILVAIGPAIGACCYDVDDERYYNFLEEFDGYSEKIFQMKGGRYHLNLMLLNYLLLIDAGIKKEHIDWFPFCTKCDKKRFFSNRRDKKHDFGEMMSFVMKL